jgi:hypothetical protein
VLKQPEVQELVVGLQVRQTEHAVAVPVHRDILLSVRGDIVLVLQRVQ